MRKAPRVNGAFYPVLRFPLDGPTRQALLQAGKPSTAMIKLTADDVSGPFVYPFPKKPEDQAKLPFLGYRTGAARRGPRAV